MESEFRVDSLVMAVVAALRARSERGDSLSGPERVAVSVDHLETEVNSGGFGSLFDQGDLEYVAMLAPALREIGCPTTAVIVDDAWSALGLAPGATRDQVLSARWGAREAAIEARLNELNTRLYRYDEPITESLWDYIKEHRTEIRLASDGRH